MTKQLKNILRSLLIAPFLFCNSHAGTSTSITVQSGGQDAQRNFYIYDSKEFKQPIAFLSKALQQHKLPEKIGFCMLMVDMPAGTAHGNHSYGGVCETTVDKKSEYFMICADEMIGHFKFEPLPEPPADEVNELARFVSNNCFGG